MAMAAGVVHGDDYNAGCVGCENGAGGGGGLVYVGTGCGEYQAQSTYRYVGYGGDFTSVRRRRDFTCLITTVLLAMLMLLLLWISYPCQFVWIFFRYPICEPRPPTWTPPTLPPVVHKFAGRVDPFNCANDEATWAASWSDEKKRWCCDVHGKGCAKDAPAGVAAALAWYDCNVGFENYVTGWSSNKAHWCCSHGKPQSCDYDTQHAAVAGGQVGFGVRAQNEGIFNHAAGGGAPIAVVRSHFNPNYAPQR